MDPFNKFVIDKLKLSSQFEIIPADVLTNAPMLVVVAVAIGVAACNSIVGYAEPPLADETWNISVS